MNTRALSASDLITLEPGTALEVVSGDVLVFVHHDDGPRCPLMTLRTGEWAVGVRVAAGIRLVLTGLPGTEVREHQLHDLPQDLVQERMAEWAYRLGEAGRGSRWASRVIAPKGTSLRCAPGENVSSGEDSVSLADRSIQGWLRVTSGSARWCGVSEANIGPLDAPLPITRGVWITSGLRCFITDAQPPADLQEWQASLDLVATCAALGVLATADEEGRRRRERLAGRQEEDRREAQEAVDQMAAAVLGSVTRGLHSGDSASTAVAGVAAAELVLQAIAIDVPEDLRDQVSRDVEAGRAAEEAIAQACNARARKVDLGSNWWVSDGPALLGSRRDGTPVALLSRGRGRVMVDPAEPGAEVTVDATVAEGLASSAVEFVRILPAGPQDVGSLMRMALQGSRADLIAISVLTLLVGLASFVTPVVFGAITTSFGSVSVGNLIALLAVLVVVLAATTSWRYVRSLALLRVRIRGVAVASGAVWDRLMRLKANWHEGKSLGSRMMRASAVTMSATLVPDAIILALLDTFIILGSLVAAATTNPSLLGAVAALLVVQLAIGLLLDRAVAHRVRARVRAASEANGQLVEILRAVNRLRISGAESRAMRRWAKVQSVYIRKDLSLRKISLAQGLLLGLWPLVTVIVLVAVTAASDATYGEFITAQTASAIATASVSAALMAVDSLLSARATLREIDDVLEAEPEGRGSGATAGRIQGSLTVRDLVFRYTPQGQAVLDGVSFSITPGEHLAIVGGSGCGKTTLMRVLLGLESPQSGTIAVDGRDLSSLDKPSVRRQVGCVLQSSSLLPGTIVENIDMGRGLTRTQVWEALDAAAVGDDIRAMAMGLDTPVVDGGGTVSGGQRQRILIARALAGNPRMLVFDEATSALDNVTQGAVVDTLDRLRLTRIVVAHRLSTIRHADRILVMDRGAIVEEGSFDDLMQRDGIFADLARRQLA